jgi:hypothetical protein
MRESCTYGSVRGASSNGGPYRNRREFIAGHAGAAAWPVAARAQQSAMPLVGFVNAGVAEGSARYAANFITKTHRGAIPVPFVSSLR